MGGKVKIRFNCIVEYLNEKQTSNFTGSVKLSFENGDIVMVNEANKHDLPTSKNTKGEQPSILEPRQKTILMAR